MELDFETKYAGVFSAFGYDGVVYVLARMRRNAKSPQIPRLGDPIRTPRVYYI
jgi:hypothetical protein